MQLGHDNLNGRHVFLGMDVNRNAAPVVTDGDGVVQVQHNFYFVAVPGHGLVNGIVDNFVHQMMEAAAVRAPDIHGRTFPNGLQTFQDSDGICVISAVWHKWLPV